MACSEEALRYNNVTDILLNTFGDVLHRDTVYSIVESCCGDLNHAANAIMSITSEENNRPPPIENPSYYGPSTNQPGRAITKKSRGKSRSSTNSYPPLGNETNNEFTTPSPNFSYAKASSSKSKNAIPKQPNNFITGFPKLNNDTLWTDQIKRIVTYHNQGTRTLIIMRGAPGSGKTYLAHQILEMTVGTAPQHVHIFSTDDYFMINGHYKHDKMNLHHAHTWNQYRAFEALDKGVSPVIIDNTNVEYWEIQPYAKAGVLNGYLLEVVEPNTTWAKNLYQLTTRNKHGVPLNTIKRMLEQLETSITSASLITKFKLAYPPDKEPPVLRNLPEIVSCCNQTFSPYTIDEIESSLQADLEMQDAISEVEDYEYTLLRDINSGTIAETPPAITPSRPNENMKYTVEQEGDCIKVKLDMENLEFKCDETIADNQGGITYEDKEKDSINDKVETEEDQNIVLDSKLLEESDKKDKIFSRIDDKVEEYDCVSAQSISQQSAPSKYMEEEVTVIEPSKSTEIKGDQLQFEKMLEEFQKLENEWENGEAWEDVNTNNAKPITTQLNTNTDSKSPRNRKTKKNKNSLKNLDEDNDWRKIYSPMSSFTDNNNISSILSKNAVETKSAETCIEVGDTDTSVVKNGFKVLFTIARDININYVPNLPEKIPENRKLDKSSMTNEVSIMAGTHRCRNEDKHFKRFRNMFKHLKKDDLRDIFENCCGDVNWAVSIVMDDMGDSRLEHVSVDEQSEVEEDIDEPCDCTSFYGIIPDVTPSDLKEEHIFNVPCTSAISTETKNVIKKQKKDSPLSDSSLALKRQIEQNIVISDQHYSEHCLKVRKMRRGILDGDDSTSQNINTGITIQNSNQLDTFSMLSIDTSNTDAENQGASGPSTFEVLDSEYNSDDEIPFKEVEKTININLGTEFLSQLDALFGRANMEYSGNIEPKINMPMSMLNEINALWMESLMCQLEAESKAHEEMIKQDEEFARALALEQLELSKSGREPEVPNFKEIMDMEFALSLYRKDCEESMQKERPNDMAAKLSVKKLYDLFPEIPQGDLDEILMAHHYDFRTTVGVLLETQGRTDVTQEENGVNKFIMAKELERQEKYLAAEKKRLMEQEMIEMPKEISMNTVNTYRSKAQSHLANWNKNFGKAKQLVKKNAAVASYYNKLAGLHLLKYELANNVAAVTLLQMNAKNNESCVYLDLHYLHVEEAKAALDIFLDSHIQSCRMSDLGEKYPPLLIITGRGLHSRGGPKIKPAAKSQLTKRQLPFKEVNPGLLSVQISPRTKLSYQIP